MKKAVIIILSIIIILILIIGAGAYYVLYYTPPSNPNEVILTNPVNNISDEQAVQQFNETFVVYLLASIGAQSLHNPPLSSDTPKIEIIIDSDIYNAEIINGGISVRKNSISNKDMILRTTKQEAVKMLRNQEYIINSFNQGYSDIEPLAGKTTLLSKGYLKLYKDLTGEEV